MYYFKKEMEQIVFSLSHCCTRAGGEGYRGGRGWGLSLMQVGASLLFFFVFFLVVGGVRRYAWNMDVFSGEDFYYGKGKKVISWMRYPRKKVKMQT